ncbi:MAG: ABC transporter ATP-binding protein [Pseudomonadota bacterium]
MNKEIAIKVEGLSKQYRIGSVTDSKLTLQDKIIRGLQTPFRRAAGLLKGNSNAAMDMNETFWALKDVSFEIQKGEVVGIIGRNGAGKSTLLKLLSRITEPTTGSATIRGRVGSLLEVGTGFHPQLTGRENVFLNGSILGMSEQEVRSKFDEIVDFSEVGKFIDTPVKYYSSGMKVRLAFAVAAHVQPEVLIVDEVLSVGDVSFRKKCMEKMHEAGASGSTVLVVSHNAQAITSMCDRAIWLNQGQMYDDGPVSEIVSRYLRQGMGLSSARAWNADEAPGGDIARLLSMRALDPKGEDIVDLDVTNDCCIETEIEVLEPGHGIVMNMILQNSDGIHAFCAVDTDNPAWAGKSWDVGVHKLRMRIPGNLLQVDTYTVNCVLWAWGSRQVRQCHVRSALCFSVVEAANKDGARGEWLGNMPGVLRPKLEWELDGPNDQQPLEKNYG